MDAVPRALALPLLAFAAGYALAALVVRLVRARRDPSRRPPLPSAPEPEATKNFAGGGVIAIAYARTVWRAAPRVGRIGRIVAGAARRVVCRRGKGGQAPPIPYLPLEISEGGGEDAPGPPDPETAAWLNELLLCGMWRTWLSSFVAARVRRAMQRALDRNRPEGLSSLTVTGELVLGSRPPTLRSITIGSVPPKGFDACMQCEFSWTSAEDLQAALLAVHRYRSIPVSLSMVQVRMRGCCKIAVLNSPAPPFLSRVALTFESLDEFDLSIKGGDSGGLPIPGLSGLVAGVLRKRLTAAMADGKWLEINTEAVYQRVQAERQRLQAAEGSSDSLDTTVDTSRSELGSSGVYISMPPTPPHPPGPPPGPGVEGEGGGSARGRAGRGGGGGDEGEAEAEAGGSSGGRFHRIRGLRKRIKVLFPGKTRPEEGWVG